VKLTNDESVFLRRVTVAPDILFTTGESTITPIILPCCWAIAPKPACRIKASKMNLNIKLWFIIQKYFPVGNWWVNQNRFNVNEG
jgi:hypothetical protein